MIKTGPQKNIVLGIGDPSKFNLLGGSFGTAGDVAMAGGYGARFFPSAKARILAMAGYAVAGGASGGGGGGPGGSPGLPRHERE